MDINADSSRAQNVYLGITSSGRVFQAFRRWPLVPTADLLRLKATLECCISVAGSGSDSAHALLELINEELSRRSPQQQTPPHLARWKGQRPRPGTEHPRPAA